MIIALASPGIASTLEEGLDKIKRLLSEECQAYLPYGHEGVLVQAIKVEEATGLRATRYAPERYQECGAVAHHSSV